MTTHSKNTSKNPVISWLPQRPWQALLKLAHNTHFRITIYALLGDTLFLSLLGFAGFVTLEALMPGFVSQHLNLAFIVFGIVMIQCARLWIASYHEGELPPSRPASLWLIVPLSIWTLLIILNSLIKFPLYAIVITFVILSVLLKLFYDEMLGK